MINLLTANSNHKENAIASKNSKKDFDQEIVVLQLYNK